MPDNEKIEQENAKQRVIDNVNRIRQKKKNNIQIYNSTLSSRSMMPTVVNEAEDIDSIIQSI